MISGANFTNTSIFSLVCTVACMFPFVGFIPGLDVQPIAFALLTAHLLFLMLTGRVVKTNVTAFLVFMTSVFLIVIVSTLFFREFRIAFLMKYAIALSTPFLIYVMLKGGHLHLRFNTIVTVAFIYILVALVQLLVYPYFLSELVSRSTSQIDLLIQSGRGVRSLTSEPSDLGLVFICLGLLLWISSIGCKPSFKKLRVSILYIYMTFLASLLLAQSVYSVILYFLILFSFVLVTRMRHFPILVAVIVLLILVLGFTDGFRRLGQIVYSIQNNDLDWVLAQGAMRRVLNAITSIVAGIEHLPFGYGDSGAPIDINYSIIGVAYEFHSSGSLYGGIFEYFYIFGIFSLPLYFLYFFCLVRIFRTSIAISGKKIRVGIPLAVSAAAITMPAGSVANPLFWLTFLAIYLFCTRVIPLSYEEQRLQEKLPDLN